MNIITNAMRAIPLDLSIAGRKRDYVFRALDTLGRVSRIKILKTDLGPMFLDWDKPAERYLAYCFYNILRYYTKSDLGRYIAASAVPGSTFLDIGANLGIYSIIARRAGLNPIAIEPEPSHVQFIARNPKLVGPVVAAAISDAPGELPLYYDARNSGATSLCNALGYAQSEFTVPVRTFDQLLSSNQLGTARDISLMKVDVEGVEIEALRGMAGFLGSGNRPDIWCEVRGDQAKRAIGSYRQVRDMLESYGYRTCEFVGGRLTSPADEDLSRRIVFDLLFIDTSKRKHPVLPT